MFWSKIPGLLPLPTFGGQGWCSPGDNLSDSRHGSSTSCFPEACFPSLAQEPQSRPAHPGTSAGSSVTFSELPACGSWRLAARPAAVTTTPVLEQVGEQSLPELSNSNSSRLPTHTHQCELKAFLHHRQTQLTAPAPRIPFKTHRAGCPRGCPVPFCHCDPSVPTGKSHHGVTVPLLLLWEGTVMLSE